ncbi:MAG: M14 family zinc carboxypeptidase [Ignavibacteriales bacterium]|nr:M14 family zinc carboxypeptidase [Ignavibacteriales bacterium]
MKTFLSFFVVVLFIASVNAQNYKKIKIYLADKQDIINLASMGFAVDEAKFERKDNSISIFLSDKEFKKLSNSSYKYDVLIDDWNKYYSKLPKLSNSEEKSILQKSIQMFGVSGFGYGSKGGHYTLQEVNNELDTMHFKYPAITTQKFQLGTSVENRPIYAFKISDNPDQNENEPEVLFTGLTHAREPEGMMSVMYFMFYLLENYGTNPEVTYLVNNRQIYFVPVVNVDGYEFNGSGGMWRKNRRSPDGVDLNRNYGYMWGYDNVGSSPSLYDETYRGTAPFSEPEIQAVSNLCNTHNFKTALNYHTYGNYLIYPWGYIFSETPDSEIFREFSSDMTQFNNYLCGTGYTTVNYPTNGDSDDWMYGEQSTKNKIISMTPEVGNTGFWATGSDIFTIAQENLFPNLYLTWAAGGFVGLHSYSFDKQFFNPGDNVNLSAVLKNKGLSSASNITAQLVSLNPEVVVNNSSVNFNSISERTEVSTVSPFTFAILPDAISQGKIKLVFNIFTDGVQTESDTIGFFLGVPQNVFKDTTNNISDLWTMNGTSGWSNTTSFFYSPPNSYTDSKNGDYPNNANILMTLKNSIDLTGISNSVFSFWTRFNIEADYDYGQIKFTTNNGSTWFALPGKYSNMATGNFQPAGQYLYDGSEPEWVKEEIDISSLSGKQIKIRFELHSDSYSTQDGWYIDDITILHYMLLPVEMISFSAIAENNSVLLSWTTATELNNKGFQIQKSSDNKSWLEVAFLKGNGTTNQLSEYSFIDPNPTIGKSYYRIVQQDFDGTTKNSKSIEVFVRNNYGFELNQNYPNPFNPSTTISYQISTASYVTLKIYDVLGNEVADLVNEKKPSGIYQFEFNANSLSSGIYYYKLVAGNFSETKKMIILK